MSTRKNGPNVGRQAQMTEAQGSIFDHIAISFSSPIAHVSGMESLSILRSDLTRKCIVRAIDEKELDNVGQSNS